MHQKTKQFLQNNLNYAITVLKKIERKDRPTVTLIDGTQVYVDRLGFFQFYNEDRGERVVYENTIYAVTHIIRLMSDDEYEGRYGVRPKSH